MDELLIHEAEQRTDGVVDPKLHTERKGTPGRKGIDLDAIRSALQEIPVNSRTTTRKVAASLLGLAKTTLLENLKKLGLRSSSRYLKPLMTAVGKKARLEWTLRWVRPSDGGEHEFQHFKDFVHLHEKWFSICKNGLNHTTYIYAIPTNYRHTRFNTYRASRRR